MENQRIQLLLDKYDKGICTDEELAELDAWYDKLDKESYDKLPESIYGNADYFLTEKYGAFKKRVNKKSSAVMFRPWIRMAAAIFLLIGISTAIWIVARHKTVTVSNTAKNDIPPGHTGAVLTLADGSTVVLDSAGNGTIARQGNVQVVNAGGQLKYNGNGNGTIAYNTLSTPKARQYQLVLPDGSKVWLNSASSIRYPVAFTGKERKVDITGEAYFEVVHNGAMPFKVMAGNTEITDIGTHFNVYAYKDEVALKTTLLEGAIKVDDKILKPGEQAQVNNDNKIKVVQLPDAEDAIAWKNGKISFDNADVPTLMRQLSRWYNLEIIYTGKVPEKQLLGSISRNTNLSTVVSALRENDIHCRIDGNKLIVEP